MRNNIKFIAAICLFASQVRSVLTLQITRVEESVSECRDMHILEGEELTRRTMGSEDHPLAISFSSAAYPQFDVVICVMTPPALQNDPTLKSMLDQKEPLPDPQSHFNEILSTYKDKPVWKVMTCDNSDTVARIFDQVPLLNISAIWEEKNNFWLNTTFGQFVDKILPMLYAEAVAILSSEQGPKSRDCLINLRGQDLRDALPVLMQNTYIHTHPEMMSAYLTLEGMAERIGNDCSSGNIKEGRQVIEALLADLLGVKKFRSTACPKLFSFIPTNNKARESEPIQSSDDPATSSSS